MGRATAPRHCTPPLGLAHHLVLMSIDSMSDTIALDCFSVRVRSQTQGCLCFAVDPIIVHGLYFERK